MTSVQIFVWFKTYDSEDRNAVSENSWPSNRLSLEWNPLSIAENKSSLPRSAAISGLYKSPFLTFVLLEP